MTDAEHPDDQQRSERPDGPPPPAEQPPGPGAEQAPGDEQQPAAPPVPPPAEPVAEEATPPVAPEAAPPAEPVAEEATPPVAPEAAPPAEPVAEEATPPVAPEAAPPAEPGDQLLDEVDETPRLRPEIPGADLIPDIIPEGEEFLDAEARAAAEAEAAEAAAQAEEDGDDEPRPIANAAIDLAAGARYTATGKRKTAVARVILKPGTGTYSINGKPLQDCFPRETLQRIIRQPLEAVGYDARMDVVARMHGGGVSAQAGALRHGVSRALIVADPHLRGELKRRGFLTRDPRVKERKKAGLKKARKRPQFSKR